MAKAKATAKTATKARKAATPAGALHATASPPYTVKDEGASTPKAGVVETPGVPAAAGEKPFDPSAWMHERLVRQIVEFEKNLGPEYEVGGRFVEGPGAEPLHITNLASWGPDMILFMGEYADGRKFELLQHYSQVSVLLMAVRKQKDDEEPRRIGFDLMKNFKDRPWPWGDPES